MKSFLTSFVLFCMILLNALPDKATAGVGDTTVVQTFRFDTTMRAGVFMFPNDTTKTYQKIIMLYSMRCKNGLISVSGNTNSGCGEWDYNCYTYVVDSSQTDSLHTISNSYTISNTTDTVFNYTTSPVYSYFQTNQQQINYTSITSVDSAIIGSGSTAIVHPLNASNFICRSQYLWTAAELSAAGLTAGNITGLQLDVLALGSNIENLKIKLKHTAQSVLNSASPDLNGFTEVYYLNTSITATGNNSFNFYNPFNWDGTSNIIVEFSYTNASSGVDQSINGHDAGFASTLTSNQPDSYVNFDGSLSYLKVSPAAYDSISNEITVAFWCYGNSAQLPSQTIMAEAYDSADRRQVNLHLPWSDSNIYWDCGNDGTGYDRINKLATTAEIEGRWNFWAFTKNSVTGSMKIYLNGNLWHSGTGKIKSVSIANMLVGKGIGSAASYRGYLDEFSLWNKELSLASIQQIMNSDITASHPEYAYLLCYYQFNADAGSVTFDSSPHASDGYFINPGRRSHRGNTLFRNFSGSTFRPNTTFVKGVYTSSLQSLPVLDSVLNNATSVIAYGVANNELNVIDTTYVWPSGYTYVYDTAGIVIDSVAIATQNTINVTSLEYYRKRAMRMELINFITPYGINLNMNGLTGKTWEFDVTDYAPLLKGARYMAMEDGKYQEDNDIKFVFYEGTPPRKAKSISQIWPSGTWVSPSYNEIVNNVYFEPRNIQLSSNDAGFKVRSAISGHGQEGEFIQRSHTIKLNGTINFTRQVWKECANNPIYPQGGTWVYDRAGWCPGAAVDMKEYELTNNVTPGQSITLDYSLPAITNPGSSNYRVNNQLVSYEAPNFTLDAAVDYIKTPSQRTEFTRLNPICNQPVIAIKNTGSTTLTSLDITYGRSGGAMSTYQWTGSLAWLASAEITLPAPNWLGSNINEFVAILGNPNGGVDQYAYNDTMRSVFNIPAVYPAGIIFELKTNNQGSGTAYTLKDSQGNIIITQSGLANNTIYRDTVNLLTDCYTVNLTDVGQDGLTWWANTGQGSGYFRIKNLSGVILKNYNSDFGQNIYEQFTINYVLPVNEINNTSIENLLVYPNPAADILTVQFSLLAYTNSTIKLTNMIGEVIKIEKLLVTQAIEKVSLDINGVDNGIYFVIVESNGLRKAQKIVIAK